VHKLTTTTRTSPTLLAIIALNDNIHCKIKLQRHPNLLIY
jgi:hypothetical protein